MVNDRLPSMVEMVSASVAGGAGQCVLTEATRPQLLTCTMSDALAPGAVTSVITVVVKADITVASGSTIVNQAMVHGAFAEAVMSGLGTGGGELSCVPVVAGTVCDPSVQVGVPLARRRSARGCLRREVVAVLGFVASLPTERRQALRGDHGVEVDRAVDVWERLGHSRQLFVDQRRRQLGFVDVEQQQLGGVGVVPLDHTGPLGRGAAVDVALLGQVDAACRSGVRAPFL